MEEAGRKRVKSLRFSQYVRKQKAMELLCDRVVKCGAGNKKIKDKRRVVVAFGAGFFSSSFKGNPPVPVRGLRKKLRQRGIEVYDVIENYTSQLCNVCNEKLGKFRDPNGKDTYSVRYCQNILCSHSGMYFNRDVNAALNIYDLFIHHCLQGPEAGRPEKFRMTYQQNHNGSA